jgi:hypothetical protein
VGAVPALAAVEVLIEEVNAFGRLGLGQVVRWREQGTDVTVLQQVVVERRAAAPLRTDDQELRMRPERGSCHAVGPDELAPE